MGRRKEKDDDDDRDSRRNARRRNYPGRIESQEFPGCHSALAIRHLAMEANRKPRCRRRLLSPHPEVGANLRPLRPRFDYVGATLGSPALGSPVGVTDRRKRGPCGRIPLPRRTEEFAYRRDAALDLRFRVARVGRQQDQLAGSGTRIGTIAEEFPEFRQVGAVPQELCREVSPVQLGESQQRLTFAALEWIRKSSK